ncbi:MAG: hypothetical protein CMM76_16235 [Rhodospirillaceae bacterium]|nr:hypothetical protein [Rhodospirillaceae bacterium]MBE90977.1 hypothetical protein [Rhodospirillaceae bacterium]|tara:strand:- start:696 stop:1331 length:636 start_codon:yes stop_codon:yes gene_type:complete
MAVKVPNGSTLNIPIPTKGDYKKNIGWRYGNAGSGNFLFLNDFNLHQLEIGYAMVVSDDWIFSTVDRRKMDLLEQRNWIKKAYAAVRSHLRKIGPDATFQINTLSEQVEGAVWEKKLIKRPDLFRGYKVFRVPKEQRVVRSKKSEPDVKVRDLFGKSELKSAPVGVKQVVLDFGEMPACYAYLLGKADRYGVDPGEIILKMLDQDMQKVSH